MRRTKTVFGFWEAVNDRAISMNGGFLTRASTITFFLSGSPFDDALEGMIHQTAGREGVTQEEYELSVGRVWKIGSVERMLMKSKAPRET
jgi:hypothetical protein